MRPVRTAVIQMRATGRLEASVALAGQLTRQAIDAGAEIIVLPENHAGIGGADDRRAWAFRADRPLESAALAPFAPLARDGRVIILGGVPEWPDDRSPDDREPGWIHNTLVVLHEGTIAATYRKIHLFDARLPDGTELGESGHTIPGETPTVLETPRASVGLSVCYDLRFPELYRALTDAGAELMVVPSAFTLLTGMAHWDVLVRARAIENQCWVLAPAQWGVHGPGRHSYGASMIVDPWGTVIQRAGTDGDAVLVADLDPRRLQDVRRDLPALSHRRLRGETSVRRIPLPEGAP